jgi:hypothetical protein
MNYAGKKYWWFVVAVVAVFVMWAGYGFVISSVVRTPEERGLFGDEFGALNTLFAGLAFAAFLVALLLQKESIDIQADELRHQRNELKETQLVLKEQKDQLKLQSDTMKLQAFESTFFQLLGLYNETVNDLSDESADKNYFSRAMAELMDEYRKAEPHMGGSDELQIIDKAFGHFLRSEGDNIGHYFRLINGIMDFVDRSIVEDKKFYIKLLFALFSDREMALVFYHAISEAGASMLPLLKKYGVMCDLKPHMLIDREKHISLLAAVC